MNVEMVTCVMIRNTKNNEVLVQNRKRKYLGWSFPGGHVEKGESFYNCAVREVKEETGLDVFNLKYCGVVHWAHKETNARYTCFMYEGNEFTGTLITETDEGEQFWVKTEDLKNTPREKFSSEHYCLSPLFHEYGKYSEVFITLDEEGHEFDVEYF